jgi:transposase
MLWTKPPLDCRVRLASYLITQEDRHVQEATLSLVEQRFLAKKHMIVLMQSGHSWQDASRQAGVQISRSSAYRLLQAVRLRGEGALQDGRHGHPAKLREPVLTFLETTVKPAPETPSSDVQAALHKQFGITVSIGHLNRVRAQLGLGSRVARRKKTTMVIFPC